MDIKDYFIAESNKYNHFTSSDVNSNNKCKDCVRKHYSYPDCCNDGWENLNKTGCLNFKKLEVG